MYQLGLAGATPEVPRMSVSLGANRWASRVVVVLQLAAWTAVGIVLLQKGVSSLQKTANNNVDKNVTQLNYTETVANLFMKKINDNESVGGSSRGKEWRSEFRSASDVDSKIVRAEVSSEKANSVDPNSPQSTGNNLHLSGVSLSQNEDENDKVIAWNAQNNLYGDYFPNIIKEDDKDNPQAPSNAEKGGNKLPSEAPNSSTNLSPNSRLLNNGIKKSANTSESRRNLKPLNRRAGGAAAAAVAMVAVGAVMLVLGPAVIVLRALDERRQERRFLKLSGQDDLPPSYEQATLMDEAPRYSTLSLNTILGASSTTVTAVSASDRCDRDRSTVQEV